MSLNNADLTVAEASSICVKIPDLFADIMAEPAQVNPFYSRVKEAGDAWVAKVLNLDEYSAKRNAKANLALLSASWVPSADQEGCRLMTDWNHWVFAYDDQFDEGDLRADPLKAAEEVKATLAVLEDGHPFVSMEDNPIRHIFQNVWFNFCETASPDLQERFKSYHHRYMLGCLKQVHWSSIGHKKLSVEQYMDYRRASVGTYPSFPVIECATGVDLPRSVMQHPSILICEEAITDIVILGNDILSMRKDLKFDVEHNIVTRLRDLGFSMQDAMDQVSDMLDRCYERWHDAVAELPRWGDEIDDQVSRLLQGYCHSAVGTLHWSFESKRYLGAEGPEIRKTQLMRVPINHLKV